MAGERGLPSRRVKRNGARRGFGGSTKGFPLEITRSKGAKGTEWVERIAVCQHGMEDPSFQPGNGSGKNTLRVEGLEERFARRMTCS